MKKLLLLIFSIVYVGSIFGQEPATTNVPNQRFPMVLPDNRVEFQIKAPEAKQVQVDLGHKYDMVKDDAGVWKVTTDPQGAGIHYYSLIIDGVSVSDPASETFYGCGRMMSCIEIPYGDGEKQYEVSDVPHGDVRIKYYFSTTTNKWRKLYVYTPAGYDKSITEKYPVLYIMHGGGEDARGWMQQGRTDIILDNLIAAGKAVKMLVVSFDANVGGYAEIEKEIMGNVVPFIEKNYRVQASADKRALAGLSMGGIYTLYVGIPHYNYFHYLGVFSSGWFAQKNPFFGNGNEAEDSYKFLTSHKNEFNSSIKLFWLSMGGNEDIAYNNGKIMRDRFDQLGIKYKYYDSGKGGHTWPVWREDLYLFAPQLFR